MKKITFGTFENKKDAFHEYQKSLSYEERLRLCIQVTERNHWRNSESWKNGINKNVKLKVYTTRENESLEELFKRKKDESF